MVIHNFGMTKEELDRRCAEMRAKYAATRTRDGVPPVFAPPSPAPARRRAVTPPPTPPALPASNYEIDKPHPLIRITMKGIRDLRPGWRAQEPLLATAGDGRLDFKVSPELLKRAAWVMDGFIKRFEAEGMHVSVKDRATLVEMNGQTVPVRIREGINQLDVPPEQRKDTWHKRLYRASGILHFEIVRSYGPDRLSSDTARWRLEERADRIVGALRQRLEELKRREDERHVAEIMRQHEARQEARHEKQRAEMKQRTESLLEDVEAWHQSARIRAYLAAFRTQMEKWSGPVDPEAEVGKWLAWANRYADSIDPLNPSGCT